VELTDENDLTYNVIPAVGINISSGDSTRYDFTDTKMQSVRVEILSIEDFDPQTDLKSLTGDSTAGLSLWRDNKSGGEIGSFNATDTFVPTNATIWTYEGNLYDEDLEEWVNKYSTTLVLQSSIEDQGYIYPYDYHPDYPHGPAVVNKTLYRGTDFYLAFRTTEFLTYGARFRVKIPYEGIWTTAGKAAYNTLPLITREINGNVFTKITSLTPPGFSPLEASSEPTRLFKVELNDNGSAKNPQIVGLSVEFYDRGDFNLSDLASFAHVAPVFNGETSWYDVTYQNTNELKKCGVVIYSDDTLTNPVMISRYRTLSWSGLPDGYQFEFSTPLNIPTTLYVAIRTSATFTPGDSFDAGIVGWGLNNTAWEKTGSRAIPIVDINSLETTSYARKQSGIFNTPASGTIMLLYESGYGQVILNWTNARNFIPADSFIEYQIIRDGVVIETVTDIDTTTWTDNTAEDGEDYTYSVNIIYTHGSGQQTIWSNEITTRVLSFTDSQAPDFWLAASGYTVTLHWQDNSYDPDPIPNDTYDARAMGFFFRRTYLEDGTQHETYVASQFTEENPHNIQYQYTDSGLQPGIYVYELFMVKTYQGGADKESKPEVRWTPVFPEEEGVSGAGGCFIATAAYGTEMAKEVSALRRFRDEHLLKNRAGRAFVRWYYRHSPPVADFIRDKGILKAAIRLGLKPLLWLLK